MAVDIKSVSNDFGHVALTRTWLGIYRVDFYPRRNRHLGISKYNVLRRRFFRLNTAEAVFRSTLYKHLRVITHTDGTLVERV
jgi:hypothetical protein